MKPIEAKSGSGQQLSSSEIEQKVEVAPWRCIKKIYPNNMATVLLLCSSMEQTKKTILLC
jgi:hypothetical protein